LPGAADLDFRAIHAFDEKNAFLLSIGNGEKSRIYRTLDGGEQWQLGYTNPIPKDFSMHWRSGTTRMESCSRSGRRPFRRHDYRRWRRILASQKDPAALRAKARSPRAIRADRARRTRSLVRNRRTRRSARVSFRRCGKNMDRIETPIRNDGASAGIFRSHFRFPSRRRSGRRLQQDHGTAGNIAITSDGGKTWTASRDHRPPDSARRSRISSKRMWIAAELRVRCSIDDGKSWKPFDTGNYNAIGIAPGRSLGRGPKGAIAR